MGNNIVFQGDRDSGKCRFRGERTRFDLHVDPVGICKYPVAVQGQKCPDN